MPEKPSEKCLLEGNRFNVFAMEIEGSDGKTYLREVVRHPGAVVLLPLLDNDTIVMIENSRPTVGQTLLELPAGTREPPEPADQTAARELIEETGYRASNLRLLSEFYSAPGVSDELMSLYLATELTEGKSAREATEQIQNRIVSRKEAEQLIHENMIMDAKTLVGLMYFLHRLDPL